MSCPHSLVGSPSSCSMCIGAVPRIVERDPDTGVMSIDGRPVDRKFLPASTYRNGPPKYRGGRPTKAVAELRKRERVDNDIDD